jgi:hypothetical protein
MLTPAFVEVSHCPVCGSADGQTLNAPVMDPKPNFYVQALAAFTNMTVQAIASTIKQYKCRECLSVYLNPYFSPDILSDFHMAISPRHRLGWQNFEKQLLGQWGDVPKLSAIAKRLEDRHGPLRSYGEYACPFQGYLLATVPAQELVARLTNFELQRWSDRPGTPLPIRLVNRVQRTQARLFRALLTARRASRRVQATQALPSVGTSQRVLLVESSTQRWGLGCSKYGSCFECGASLLNCKVRFLDELAVDQEGRLDLVGCFNSLDHSTSPLRVVETLKKLARVIIVAGHLPDHAGYQHRFAFGTETIERIADRLGLGFEDITTEMWGPHAKMYATVLA